MARRRAPRVADATVPPGYAPLAAPLSFLLRTHPPPFIYVRDAHTPRLAAQTLRAVLRSLSRPDPHAEDARIAAVAVDAVACFAPRLFYDAVVNGLAGWTPRWEDGCENWPGSSSSSAGGGGGGGQRWNDSVDGFLHGLQAVWKCLGEDGGGGGSVEDEGESSRRKRRKTMMDGKGKAVDEPPRAVRRLVLLVERAERLSEFVPDLVVPLTRLAELTGCDIVTVFTSNVAWEDIRPSLGAAPEPYFIDVPALSKQATLDILLSSFPSPSIPDPDADADNSSSASTSDSDSEAPAQAGRPTSRLVDPHTYDPALRPLYASFLETLYSVCAPFTRDPHELAYVAAARWPGFVQPILATYRSAIEEWRAQMGAMDTDTDKQQDHDVLERPRLVQPSENVRILLTRLFTPTFTAALEALYPRLDNAAHWAQTHAPPDALFDLSHAEATAALRAQSASAGADALATELPGLGGAEDGEWVLPRMSVFVLVAAYIASTNPAKTDLKMFGRGLDERGRRRRRKGGAPRKPRVGTTGAGVKLPQRLLGPMPFPLDRLLAILGILLEEHDADTRPATPQYTVPGEYTDMEILRVALHTQIMELASMRLLVPTSTTDKLDSVPTFKCGISYELALRLARQVGILLNDILWDPA